MSHGDDHDHGDREAAWFRILDIAVWVGVTVIGVLALEWFAGYVVRERLTAQVQRHIKLTHSAPTE